MKKLLIVVDMQNDFVTGVLGSKDAKRIVPNVVKKVQEAKKQGVDIIFTQDTHKENYMETQEGKKLPVPHCMKGTKGWEIIPELAEIAKECLCLEKPAFGCATMVHKTVRKKYEQIELVGVCTDICVISNAIIMKTALPEAEICVDASCCAGVTPESHENALQAMKMCQITILE